MTYTEFISTIETIFSLSETQREQFEKAGELYREWNEKINVISRKDIEQIYSHHILHSLAIAAYMQNVLSEDFIAASGSTVSDKPDTDERLKILDLGTGGGFPGIPLAILFPEAEFTLCDSVGKKTIVAAEVATALGLQNVKIVNARAESLPEKYDYIVSRAVTSLDKFMPWVKGKYKKGILYLKGGDLAEEISTAMSRAKLKKGSVHIWQIDNLFKDEYFKEKLVIFIENICK